MATTGLYFGSFNPIHNGHLMLANYLVENSGLDALWFVISPQNPFKTKESLLPDYQRLELVNRAIEGYKKFAACDIEFSMPKPSYTIDTLTYIRSLISKKNILNAILPSSWAPTILSVSTVGKITNKSSTITKSLYSPAMAARAAHCVLIPMSRLLTHLL